MVSKLKLQKCQCLVNKHIFGWPCNDKHTQLSNATNLENLRTICYLVDLQSVTYLAHVTYRDLDTESFLECNPESLGKEFEGVLSTSGTNLCKM